MGGGGGSAGRVEGRTDQDGGEEVVGAADVVVHGVPLVLRTLHRVRGRALLRKVDDGVWPLLANELDQEVVFLCHVQVDETNRAPGNFLPRLDANLRMRDRGERITAQFNVDVSSGEVIHNDNIMPFIRQMQRSGPPTKSISAQYNDLLLVG